MQRDEPILAALGLAQRQYPGRNIDIDTLQPNRLARAHARGRKQAEEAMIGQAVDALGQTPAERRFE